MGWFSDIEIIEIHLKVNDQQSSDNTLADTSIINKKKIIPSKRNHQLQKMKTPHYQTLHNQTNQSKHYHKNKS